MAVDPVIQPAQRQLAVDKEGRLQKATFDFLAGLLRGRVVRGTGDPSGVVVADIGTIYSRVDGGAGSTLYIKEGNSGTSAGWRAV